MEERIKEFYDGIRNDITLSISPDGKLCMRCPYYVTGSDRCNLYRRKTVYGHRTRQCQDTFTIDNKPVA